MAFVISTGNEDSSLIGIANRRENARLDWGWGRMDEKGTSICYFLSLHFPLFYVLFLSFLFFEIQN